MSNKQGVLTTLLPTTTMSDDQNQEAALPEPSIRSPEKTANQIRFETELEFVQCLANPHYLASLATQGLLSQPNFIAYLKYLTYWLDVEKGFGRFIVYASDDPNLDAINS